MNLHCNLALFFWSVILVYVTKIIVSLLRYFNFCWHDICCIILPTLNVFGNLISRIMKNYSQPKSNRQTSDLKDLSHEIEFETLLVKIS